MNGKFLAMLAWAAPILAAPFSFNAPHTYGGFVSQIFTVVAADFNGDGKLDLVAGTGFGYQILLGNGDGTFQLLPMGTTPGGLAVADFNGDGKLDLAIVDGESTLAIVLGSGDGTFQSPTTYNTRHGRELRGGRRLQRGRQAGPGSA